jgi:ketosteroid isomerase-like protein
MATTAFDEFVQQYHQALDEFFKGNPLPAQALYSRGEDATLANPFGPIARGWAQISAASSRAAANFRGGGATGFETAARLVTPELAYLVEVESFQAKIGGSEDMAAGALRVTSILRPEQGLWKILHRHADPITSTRPPESVMGQGS